MSVDAGKLQIEVLRNENAELRVRLDEAEEILRAIRTGEVDALVVGEQLYTLASAESASNQVRGEMLAQVNDAVVAVDNDNRIIFLNAAAEQQYGVSASEVLGHEVDRVFRSGWMNPGDEAAARKAWSTTGSWRGESIHIRRDGEELAVESSVTRLTDTDGTPIGLLTVIRDITARKQAEDEVRRLNTRLEAIVAERTQRLEEVIGELDAFAFSVSHDLRAPLRAMYGHATALLEDCGPALDDLGRKYAERIVAASERMDSAHSGPAGL